MEIKISVIIPAYNVAGYIEHCLESILSQTFCDFEVIVIDDGSTDNTPQIIDEFAAKDSRIHPIHKVNEGVSIARNTGIKEARGEYILFFDGDDFVVPYCMEELYQLMKEKDADTILYGYHRYENGKVKETTLPIFPEGMYQGADILSKLAIRFIGVSEEGVNQWLRGGENGLYVENPALWRAMVSASIIRENQLIFDKNLKVGEDTVFITNYLSYAKKCYVHPKCYYYLVTRETSTIYVYEQNPVAKLEGKQRLLDAREQLTKDVLNRRKFDISKYWAGTVLMSAVEIAFLMSKKNSKYGFMQRYRLFLSYLKDVRVQRIIQEFQLEKQGGIKRIPFLFLKHKWYFLLFLSTALLNLVHYQFQR